MALALLVLAAPGCERQADRDARQALGGRLFEEQRCVVCHGAAGRGDGPRARALDPPPRDFRDRSAYLQGTSARAIAETVASGIRVHSAAMPTFSHLTEEERLALGEFIVSLQRDGRPPGR